MHATGILCTALYSDSPLVRQPIVPTAYWSNTLNDVSDQWALRLMGCRICLSCIDNTYPYIILHIIMYGYVLSMHNNILLCIIFNVLLGIIHWIIAKHQIIQCFYSQDTCSVICTPHYRGCPNFKLYEQLGKHANLGTIPKVRYRIQV